MMKENRIVAKLDFQTDWEEETEDKISPVLTLDRTFLKQKNRTLENRSSPIGGRNRFQNQDNGGRQADLLPEQQI